MDLSFSPQAQQRLGVRTAVLRYEGSDWVYVAGSAGRFQRRLLQDPAPEAGGLFVARGLRAGETVAVDGVAQLFAAEQGQARQGG